jgi:hypothetical protein
MCDLSAKVRRDLGRFDSRDALFIHYGQTLCWPARTLAEPFLSRWGCRQHRTSRLTTSRDPYISSNSVR